MISLGLRLYFIVYPSSCDNTDTVYLSLLWNIEIKLDSITFQQGIYFKGLQIRQWTMLTFRSLISICSLHYSPVRSISQYTLSKVPCQEHIRMYFGHVSPAAGQPARWQPGLRAGRGREAPSVQYKLKSLRGVDYAPLRKV